MVINHLLHPGMILQAIVTKTPHQFHPIPIFQGILIAGWYYTSSMAGTALEIPLRPPWFWSDWCLDVSVPMDFGFKKIAMTRASARYLEPFFDPGFN